jgi:hypothetical protein
MPTHVQFLVRDIIHPHPVEVLCELYQHNQLEGEVIATTDDGRQPNGYLVVRVPNVSEPVIVPAQSVRPFVDPYQTARAR